MVQVSPSILSADFANLERDCRRVVTKENPMLHFDVMDGVFVPNITVGLPVLQSLSKAIPEAVYDVHLMIANPLKYVEEFAKAGADIITFHLESEADPRETLRAIRQAKRKAGLSLRPDTPVEELFPYLKDADLVLIMSVEPGFGGQVFRENAPARIRALKAEMERQGVSLAIEVDGGINPQTARLCIEAGAEMLVAGSAVFHTDDPAKAVREIRGL